MRERFVAVLLGESVRVYGPHARRHFDAAASADVGKTVHACTWEQVEQSSRGVRDAGAVVGGAVGDGCDDDVRAGDGADDRVGDIEVSNGDGRVAERASLSALRPITVTSWPRLMASWAIVLPSQPEAPMIASFIRYVPS